MTTDVGKDETMGVTSREAMPMATTAMAGVIIGGLMVIMATMAKGNERIIRRLRYTTHHRHRRALVSFSRQFSFVLKNADSEA
jgi:hypothetical protein